MFYLINTNCLCNFKWLHRKRWIKSSEIWSNKSFLSCKVKFYLICSCTNLLMIVFCTFGVFNFIQKPYRLVLICKHFKSEMCHLDLAFSSLIPALESKVTKCPIVLHNSVKISVAIKNFLALFCFVSFLCSKAGFIFWPAARLWDALLSCRQWLWWWVAITLN